MGTIAICCWALLSHAQNPMPSISRGLLIGSGTWLGALIFGEFSRLSETGVYGTAEMVGLLEWASLLLFLPAGLLLFRQQKYILWLLLAPVLAVVARILSHISYETWQSDLFGRGFNGFGLHHVPFGLQASLAIIALLSMGPAAVRTLPKYRYRVLARVVLVASALLITQALFRSGTRSGVICLALALAVLLWQQRASVLRALITAKGRLAAIAVFALLIIVVSVNSQTLYKRFVVGAYLKADITFNLEDIPRDKDVFFGRRLYLSAFGIEQWLDKPLLLDDDPDFHIHHHLHNTYVQTLAEIGLLGSLAWASVSAVILLGVYKHGSRLGNSPLVNFFWSAAFALAVWSLQSAPVHVAYWRFAVIMVCALGLSIILQSQRQQSDHTNKYSA